MILLQSRLLVVSSLLARSLWGLVVRMSVLVVPLRLVNESLFAVWVVLAVEVS